MYKPYTIFVSGGLFFLVLGLVIFVRYFILYFGGEHTSHIQSLITGTILLIAAFLCFALGILADLIRINRILVEDTLENIKAARFDKPDNVKK